MILGKKKSHLLVVDIGTVSITAAFVRVDGGNSTIEHVFRQYYEPTIKADAARFERKVMQALADIFRQIAQESAGAIIDECRIGLSAPFYVAETIEVERNFEVRKTIENTDIQNIVLDGEKVFKSHFPSHGGEIKIFEGYILESMLNGYATALPVNQQANTLSVSMRFSALRSSLLSAVQQKLSIFGGPFPLKLYSFAPVYVAALGELLTDDALSVFVDIGGDMTEVTILRKGVIEEAHTFPFGIMNIAEAIMRDFGLDYASGVALLQKFLAEQTITSEAERIDKIILSVITYWREEFEVLFKTIGISSERAIDIYLFGGGAIMADLKGLLQTLSPLDEMGEFVKIRMVTPRSMADRIAGVEKLYGPEDFGLISLIRVHQGNNYQRIL